MKPAAALLLLVLLTGCAGQPIRQHLYRNRFPSDLKAELRAMDPNITNPTPSTMSTSTASLPPPPPADVPAPSALLGAGALWWWAKRLRERIRSAR